MPRNVMFSEHWVSTPAVDSMSPQGTYLRAYTEADHIADFNSDRGQVPDSRSTRFGARL